MARTVPAYARGMALLGKYVLIGEGVRGSLAKQLIAQFDLAAHSQPQKYGIGLKELWQVKPENFRPGFVQHSFGWPLDMKTGGGSFLYHLEDQPCDDRPGRPPQLQESVALSLRGVPALQDASGDRAGPSRAASASPMVRAPLPRAAGSRCRSCPSPAAR